MIFPSNRVRIMVATEPVDFRKGHDGLAALVKNELRKYRSPERSSCSGRARQTV
ncbi:IS66 Orf2 like protein [Phyllobacterium brassicacearum]|nr:IS66 Orf2 like protein [Phyllobacterium brassicacearum]